MCVCVCLFLCMYVWVCVYTSVQVRVFIHEPVFFISVLHFTHFMCITCVFVRALMSLCRSAICMRCISMQMWVSVSSIGSSHKHTCRERRHVNAQYAPLIALVLGQRSVHSHTHSQSSTHSQTYWCTCTYTPRQMTHTAKHILCIHTTSYTQTHTHTHIPWSYSLLGFGLPPHFAINWLLLLLFYPGHPWHPL